MTEIVSFNVLSDGQLQQNALEALASLLLNAVEDEFDCNERNCMVGYHSRGSSSKAVPTLRHKIPPNITKYPLGSAAT
jgi:hypothetical protein